MVAKELLINRPRLMLTILIVISSMVYLADYLVDGSMKEIATSFLGNLAFLPIYIIVVTLTLEQILKERERHTLRRKLNMVIGVFFSEVGTRLLRELSGCLVAADGLRSSLTVTSHWKGRDFQAACSFLEQYDVKVDCAGFDKAMLKEFLESKRAFLVGLLENQNLLEHEAFTDLLWAVFHLAEELEARDALEGLPPTDLEHLHGDIKRVLEHLLREWLLYLQHLRHSYPYLFSLAVRMNPLSAQVSPYVLY